MEIITTFLEVKLRLKVNLQKSAVDISDKRKFLGFNLYHYHERIHIRIAPQAIKRFKIKIREITSKSRAKYNKTNLKTKSLFAYWANLGLMSLTNRYCEIRSAL